MGSRVESRTLRHSSERSINASIEPTGATSATGLGYMKGFEIVVDEEPFFGGDGDNALEGILALASQK